MTTLQKSATEQLNKLIEFRQIVYGEILTTARDGLFETIDSLLLSDHPRSFAELSLSLVYRRQWSSLYDALERGRLNEGRLERLLVAQVPSQTVQVFPLDTTMWSHPSARPLSDLVYAPSPTRALPSRSVVQGHQYSLLSWTPPAGSSWSPVLMSHRVKASARAIDVGVVQVKQLCRYRPGPGVTVIAADGAYGNHHFLGSLRAVNCAKVCRLRRDRVLYGAPGPYAGRGGDRAPTGIVSPSRNPTPGESQSSKSSSAIPGGGRFAYAAGTICTPNKMRIPLSP